ncbi:MAG: hypothetical protein WDM81_09905 [Rhizomicrobium sp.]
MNMTKLESYQLGGSFNATQFYADIEGHPGRRRCPPRAGRACVLHLEADRAPASIPAHEYRDDMP